MDETKKDIKLEINVLSELVKKLEEKRKAKTILITMDESRSIDRPLVSQLYELLEKMSKETPFENLDVIIDSAGGDADAAYHIAKLLRNYCKGKLTFIVPRFAKSAATLLCCAGDSIVMNLPSELGPLDTQIFDPMRGVSYSALSIKETMKFLDKIEREWREDKNDFSKVIAQAIKSIPLMEIGDHLRSLNHIADYLKELLSKGMFKEEYKNNEKDFDGFINKIIHNLIEEHYSHGKCITCDTAKSMGLKIEEVNLEQWEIIWKIYRLLEQERLRT